MAGPNSIPVRGCGVHCLATKICSYGTILLFDWFKIHNHFNWLIKNGKTQTPYSWFCFPQFWIKSVLVRLEYSCSIDNFKEDYPLTGPIFPVLDWGPLSFFSFLTLVGLGLKEWGWPPFSDFLVGKEEGRQEDDNTIKSNSNPKIKLLNCAAVG